MFAPVLVRTVMIAELGPVHWHGRTAFLATRQRQRASSGNRSRNAPDTNEPSVPDAVPRGRNVLVRPFRARSPLDSDSAFAENLGRARRSPIRSRMAGRTLRTTSSSIEDLLQQSSFIVRDFIEPRLHIWSPRDPLLLKGGRGAEV